MWEDFEKYWNGLNIPTEFQNTKQDHWIIWLAAHKRVADKLCFMKGITERCQGFNEAMRMVESIVEDKNG